MYTHNNIIKNHTFMVINVKESPGHFCSYRQNSRQCKRLLWRVEQAQMSLLKKIVLKILRAPTIYTFPHKFMDMDMDMFIAPGP